LPPLASLDAQGFATFQETVLSGLSGIVVTLHAFLLDAQGRPAVTNDEKISFR
jgi:hypothetical protein